MTLPAVPDLIRQVRVAQRPHTASHDEQQVVWRRFGPNEVGRRKAHASTEERGADLVGRLSLHRRRHVAVEVGEQRGVGVAEALGGHLGRHAVGETGNERCSNRVE